MQRTLALEEVYRTFAIANNLDFDMTRIIDNFLDVKRIVAKRCPGLGPRLRRLVAELFRVCYRTDAPASTAADSLDHHGKADLAGYGQTVLNAGYRAGASRYSRHPRLQSQCPGPGLVAHLPDGLSGRADEAQTRTLNRVCKPGILGQKSVPRVHCVGAGYPGSLKDRVPVQVRPGGLRRAYVHRFIGHAHGRHAGVCVAVNLRCPDPHFARGTDNPYRDLAAISDQQLPDSHAPQTHSSSSTSTCPAITASSFSTRKADIRPAAVAFTS